jgi:hypothetical protein
MKVVTRAEVLVPKPPQVVFDYTFVTETFQRLLAQKGPIPGIRAIDLHEGATAVAVGVRRSVSMTDGSVILEEIVKHDPPREHAYRWLNRPAPPFSLLVAGGETTWSFEPASGGTRVSWTYWFDLTSPFARPPVYVVQWLFRRWMQAALDRLRDELSR